MVHRLKTWTEPFGAIRRGEKTHEFRKNDRNFQVGDVLELAEYTSFGFYSGEVETRVVTYISRGPEWGIPDGYCVMSIGPVKP